MESAERTRPPSSVIPLRRGRDPSFNRLGCTSSDVAHYPVAISLILCAIKALAQTPSATPPGVHFERVLVIGTKVAPPCAIKDDRGEWTRVSIEFWKHIAEQLKLRYRFKETTLQGLVGETADGELDGAIAAITVTGKREQVVDLTQIRDHDRGVHRGHHVAADHETTARHHT